MYLDSPFKALLHLKNTIKQMWQSFGKTRKEELSCCVGHHACVMLGRRTVGLHSYKIKSKQSAINSQDCANEHMQEIRTKSNTTVWNTGWASQLFALQEMFLQGCW